MAGEDGSSNSVRRGRGGAGPGEEASVGRAGGLGRCRLGSHDQPPLDRQPEMALFLSVGRASRGGLVVVNGQGSSFDEASRARTRRDGTGLPSNDQLSVAARRPSLTRKAACSAGRAAIWPSDDHLSSAVSRQTASKGRGGSRRSLGSSRAEGPSVSLPSSPSLPKLELTPACPSSARWQERDTKRVLDLILLTRVGLGRTIAAGVPTRARVVPARRRNGRHLARLSSTPRREGRGESSNISDVSPDARADEAELTQVVFGWSGSRPRRHADALLGLTSLDHLTHPDGRLACCLSRGMLVCWREEGRLAVASNCTTPAFWTPWSQRRQRGEEETRHARRQGTDKEQT